MLYSKTKRCGRAAGWDSTADGVLDVAAIDGVYVYSSLSHDGGGNFDKFDFSDIPLNSIINSIKVKVYADGPNDCQIDKLALTYDGIAVIQDITSNLDLGFGFTFYEMTYDQATPSYRDVVNNPNFGIMMTATNNGSGSIFKTLKVDYIEITITYTVMTDGIADGLVFTGMFNSPILTTGNYPRC